MSSALCWGAAPSASPAAGPAGTHPAVLLVGLLRVDLVDQPFLLIEPVLASPALLDESRLPLPHVHLGTREVGRHVSPGPPWRKSSIQFQSPLSDLGIALEALGCARPPKVLLLLAFSSLPAAHPPLRALSRSSQFSWCLRSPLPCRAPLRTHSTGSESTCLRRNLLLSPNPVSSHVSCFGG